MGATPNPPPTRTTVPSSLRMWLGSPRGPKKSRRVSPSRNVIISKVVLPTAWITTVTVPWSALKSAKVTGTRRSRHVVRLYVPEECRRTKLFSTSDEKHHTPWKQHSIKNWGKILFLSCLGGASSARLGKLKLTPRDRK